MTVSPPDFRKLACSECVNGGALGFDFSMAFQPIVDVRTKSIFAYEALARGLNGEGFGTIAAQVNHSNRYRFDQTCRVKAIELAARLGMQSRLSINFMPNAIYKPELCIRTTIDAAERHGFPREKIIFEITESEKVEDREHLRGIIDHYQSCNFITALDDFGSGHSSLNLLADMQTDILKMDMYLIQGISSDPVKQGIVYGVALICENLGIIPVVEGVETKEDKEMLEQMGIKLMQGFYFGKPRFEALTPLEEINFGD